MIPVEFTLEELTVLQQLLNIAVMARGLDVAQPCLVLNQKIVSAAQEYEASQKAADESKTE